MTRLTVVSGGGTGIGYAIARAFAGVGDDVWILGRRAEVLRSAAEKINTEAGGHPVDVVVNNAGGGTSFGPKSSLSEVADAWRREFDVNVLTAVLLTTALRDRLRRPGGRIVSVSGSRRCAAARAPTAPRSPRRTAGRTTSRRNSAPTASPPTWWRPATWRRRSSSAAA